MKKQNILKVSLLVLMLTLATLYPAYTAAATTGVTGGTNGPLCNSGGYFTPSSVTVISGDTITFSVPSNDPYAGGVQINGFPQGSFVVPRGGSVTTQALTAGVSYQGTWPGSPSCIKGSGTLTVEAPSNSGGSSSGSSGSSSSGSSTPTSTPSSTSTPKTAKSTTAPSTSATQPTAVPETVVTDTITIAGKNVTPPEGQGLTIKQSQPMMLSGTTVPNGKITLTIHSNPTTATVQANSSGKWSYTVTGLSPGSHTIYAVVTDPATNQTSASSKLLAFTIAAAPVASVTHAAPTFTKKSSSSRMAVVLGVLGLFVLAAIALVILKMKTKHKASPTVTPPTSQPSANMLQPTTIETQVPLVTTVPQIPPTPTAPTENNQSDNHQNGAE